MIEGRIDVERLFESDVELMRELTECSEWILEGTLDLVDILDAVAAQGAPVTGKDARWTFNGIAEIMRMRDDLLFEFKRLDDRLVNIAVSLSDGDE